jgi:hypothetical protein
VIFDHRVYTSMTDPNQPPVAGLEAHMNKFLAASALAILTLSLFIVGTIPVTSYAETTRALHTQTEDVCRAGRRLP